MRLRPATIVMLATMALGAQPTLAQGRLKEYKTKYYVLHTDISVERAHEAALRITRMAEQYHQRTSGFAGRIAERLPFYLYSDPASYYAAGGIPGSAGLFDGQRLMAIAGERSQPGLWQLIQHEGFHQFAHAVMRGEFPVWVNEGLAEYFGDSVFTGDGYIVGVIPPQRLARLKLWIEQGNTLSIEKMMELPHDAWNMSMSVVNYDQAWSMVYFLAHAENGKYQERLNRFIRDMSHGVKWTQAWKKHFGAGISAFERKWRTYWRSMPDDPTAEQYAEATVAKITSFYARAFSQQQIFTDFDDFLRAARSGRLKQHEGDWLPPGLLSEAISELDRAGKWRIRKLPGRYEVVCTRPAGNELVGRFKIVSRRVKPDSVTVTGGVGTNGE